MNRLTQNKQNRKVLKRNSNIWRDTKIRYTRQTNEWTKKFIWVTLTDDMLWCLDKVIRFYKRRLNKLNTKNVIEMQIQYISFQKDIFHFCPHTSKITQKLASICKCVIISWILRSLNGNVFYLPYTSFLAAIQLRKTSV